MWVKYIEFAMRIGSLLHRHLLIYCVLNTLCCILYSVFCILYTVYCILLSEKEVVRSWKKKKKKKKATQPTATQYYDLLLLFIQQSIPLFLSTNGLISQLILVNTYIPQLNPPSFVPQPSILPSRRLSSHRKYTSIHRHPSLSLCVVSVSQIDCWSLHVVVVVREVSSPCLFISTTTVIHIQVTDESLPVHKSKRKLRGCDTRTFKKGWVDSRL